MGILSASLSSAFTQILSPHGPLVNSTTWRAFDGTVTEVLSDPLALNLMDKNNVNVVAAADSLGCEQHTFSGVHESIRKRKALEQR